MEKKVCACAYGRGQEEGGERRFGSMFSCHPDLGGRKGDRCCWVVSCSNELSIFFCSLSWPYRSNLPRPWQPDSCLVPSLLLRYAPFQGPWLSDLPQLPLPLSSQPRCWGLPCSAHQPQLSAQPLGPLSLLHTNPPWGRPTLTPQQSCFLDPFQLTLAMEQCLFTIGSL